MTKNKHILPPLPLLSRLTLILIIFLFQSFNYTCLGAESQYFLSELPKGDKASIVVNQIELPGIPQRVPIGDLAKSLQQANNGTVINVDALNNKTQSKAKVKNFPNNTKKYPIEIYPSEKYDYLLEKSFNLNSSQLFSLSLDTIMDLGLSLKFFDVKVKEIVATDKLRNTLKLSIIDQSKNQSMIKVLGYASHVGKVTLNKTIRNLLANLSDGSRVGKGGQRGQQGQQGQNGKDGKKRRV